MSRPKLIPDDVRQTCIQIVRGYDRRKREYYDRRRDIIEGSTARFEVIKDKEDPDNWEKTSYFYPPSSHTVSKTGEDKAMQLLALEELPETKRMRAVEEARATIGLDLPEGMRKSRGENPDLLQPGRHSRRLHLGPYLPDSCICAFRRYRFASVGYALLL